jgi:hypothetical protein
MAVFFQENLATVVVSAILVGFIALTIWIIVKDRRSGILWGCGVSCVKCPFSSSCTDKYFDTGAAEAAKDRVDESGQDLP